MIYLMRHGLDDERFVGGWSDVDLVPIGIEQVKASIEFIKKNIDINKINSSDIKRAVTTSNIINNKLKIPIEYTSDLRELNKGLLNGKEVSIVREYYPEYIKNKDIYKKYPQGECLMDLYIRINDYINKVKDKTLLVTHRGVINMIYYSLNNIPLDTNKRLFDVTHASIHELDLNKRLIKKIN